MIIKNGGQQKISRIDWRLLKEWFENCIQIAKSSIENPEIVVVMERPMINPQRFMQSKNAARAFEATTIVLEMVGLAENTMVIDSRNWQHFFFGKNTVALNLKKESERKGLSLISGYIIRRRKSRRDN